MVSRGLKSKKQNLKSAEGFAGEDEAFGFEFTDDDIIGVHVQHSASSLFLDRYSVLDMRQDLQDLGILQKLRERGHNDISISFDLSDPFVQKMTWRSAPGSSSSTSTHSNGDEDDDTLLCDCVIRVLRSVSLLKAVRPSAEDPPEAREGADLIKTWATRLESEDPSGPLKLCVVEWLLLQDPLSSSTRRLLPGQRIPGLGIQRQFGRLLWKWCEDCELDAIINRPLYLHNAVMYADESTTFLNPHAEDCFRALCRDLVVQLDRPSSSQTKDLTGVAEEEQHREKQSQSRQDQVMCLGEISHAVNCGALQLTTPKGQVVKWSAQEQISGFSSRAKAFLSSKEYREASMRLWGVTHSPHLKDVKQLIHPKKVVTAGPSTPQSNDGAEAREGGGGEMSRCSSVGLYTLDVNADFDDTQEIVDLLKTAPPWHAVPLKVCI